jgi:hypothetical protein
MNEIINRVKNLSNSNDLTEKNQYKQFTKQF